MELQTAEKALQRQKKKKTSKLKEKNLAKVARGLEVPKEAFGADEDPNLFDLQSIKSKQVCLSAVNGIWGNALSEYRESWFTEITNTIVFSN